MVVLGFPLGGNCDACAVEDGEGQRAVADWGVKSVVKRGLPPDVAAWWCCKKNWIWEGRRGNFWLRGAVVVVICHVWSFEEGVT